MLTAEQIGELARRFKIDEASIVREYVQLLFLRSFYALKEGRHVFFKGGTAIHFHYGSFRFSEDLDFSTLQSSDQLRQMVEAAARDLKTEMASLEQGKFTIKHDSFIGQLKFAYKGSRPLTIRLEFSQREKALTKAVSLIETPFPLVSYPLVVHLDAEDLLAEKARAILTRSKGRDYFDFWYLLSKEIPLREDYIREKMKWYVKDYRQEDLTEIIADANEKDLYNDLARFLPKHYRQIITDLKKNILKKLGL
ncbi:MAG: nucleotidyl transferase AbiEii/AbiGii toxin family protein [Pseudomonadota bacterium]